MGAIFGGAQNFRSDFEQVKQNVNTRLRFKSAQEVSAAAFRLFDGTDVPANDRKAYASLAALRSLSATKDRAQSPLDWFNSQGLSVEQLQGNTEDFAASGFYQSAGHVSPALFDRFDHSFIGTGEGNQVYGWGTYLAESPQVLDYYREFFNKQGKRKFTSELSQNLDEAFSLLTVNGKPLLDEYKLPKNSTFFRRLTHYPPMAVSEQIDAWTKLLDGKVSKETRKDGETFLSELKRLEADLESGVSVDFKGLDNLAHRYEVEFPDFDGSNFLDWDNHISAEQAGRIYDGLQTADFDETHWAYKEGKKEDFVKFYASHKTGESLYKELSVAFGSQKAASQFLNSIGIVGNRYLDGTSRNSGKGSYNYVIFNEDNAKITRTLFQSERAAAEWKSKAEEIKKRFLEQPAVVIKSDNFVFPNDVLEAYRNRAAGYQRIVANYLMQFFNSPVVSEALGKINLAKGNIKDDLSHNYSERKLKILPHLSLF